MPKNEDPRRQYAENKEQIRGNLDLTVEDWILALIAYAGGKLKGKTRIQKGLFLVWQEIGGVKADFAPYKYGPYSKDIDEALNRLAGENLILERVVPGGDESPAVEYELTKRGWERARQTLNQLEESGILERARPFLDLAIKGSLIALIGFVYSMYPEWAANSEIKGRIRSLEKLKRL
ncbi:MAG: hypothetical protein GSR84_03475 [Desulfurococcales archaeon]|nr:hypothetical protein [Desulfurococcales archaeon]